MKRYLRRNVERMSGYVPGEQPRGGKIIKLNTNENPYPPSPGVAGVIAAFDPAGLRLYPDPLCRKLRAKISEIHGCDESMIFVGNGSDEILSLCTRAFVENNGSIGYFEPSYSLYPVLADIRDVEQRPVQLDGEFKWAMPAGYECSLFFLTNPNAPTGMLHDPAVVDSFCEGMAGKGVVLVDEAYVDFASDDCMDTAMRRGNAIVMRTLSKSYSLAGLRLGYCIGAPDLISGLYKIKDSYNVDMLSQAVALAALSDAAYMRANVERIKSDRARLSRFLKDNGFHVCPSEANFIWARPLWIGAESLFELLREKDVFIRFFKGGRTGEHVRITVGSASEIDAFMEAVKRIRIERS